MIVVNAADFDVVNAADFDVVGAADIDVVNAADTGGGDAQGALMRISYPTPWVELNPQGWFEQLEGQKQTEGYSVRGGMWGGIRVDRSAGDIWVGHDSPSRCFGLSAEAAPWVGGSVGTGNAPWDSSPPWVSSCDRAAGPTAIPRGDTSCDSETLQMGRVAV